MRGTFPIMIEEIYQLKEEKMSENFTIEALDQPEWGLIGGGISEYNSEQAGDDHGLNLCFIVRGPDGEAIGGVIGSTHWDWLYINLMWLKEDFRTQGYGSRLLEAAEAEARTRGARNAYLDTFSFQAPEFYKKHGYEVFGELPEFPTGHTRYFMKKTL